MNKLLVYQLNKVIPVNAGVLYELYLKYEGGKPHEQNLH